MPDYIDENGEVKSLSVIEQGGEIARPVVAADWEAAIKQAVAAKDARDKIISQILVPDTDYGTPGGKKLSDMTADERKKAKPSLYKSGAEKIGDSFHLYPQYTIVSSIEDFDKPLFYFKYECRLVHRENGLTVGTGLGSCNSMEGKYRYRNSQLRCPSCEKETIRKSKDDKGGGWYCWQKIGGCGMTFKKGDPDIENQEQGKVENDDIFTLINTVDKMAQKRAYVCAALNLGFSDAFTQDLEDIQGHVSREREPEEVKPKPQPKPAEPPKPKPTVRTVSALIEGANNANDIDTLDKIEKYLDTHEASYDTDQRKSIHIRVSIRKDFLRKRSETSVAPKPKPEVMTEVQSDEQEEQDEREGDLPF